MDFSRSPITRRAAAALAFSAPIGLTAIAAAGDEEARRPEPAGESKDGPGRFEAWWRDLEKGKTEAARVLLEMAGRREETVAFLKARIKPLKVTAAEVRALLLKLGSENEKVWKPAFDELEYFDPRLAFDLQTLMDHYTETPGRQRMVEILSGFEAGKLGNQGDPPQAPARRRRLHLRLGDALLAGRAQDRSPQGHRPGSSQEEVGASRAGHRAARALRHPGRRRHPPDHGHRPPRRPADQGGQGRARTPRPIRQERVGAIRWTDRTSSSMSCAARRPR